MSRVLNRFVEMNAAISRRFDEVLPGDLRVDGNYDFRKSFVEPYLRAGQTIYDIGGGKTPFLSVEKKQSLGSRVIGVDISREQLSRAPDNAYDDTVVADIREFSGRADADLVICQALLEHVPDAQSAIRSIASVLRPGGILLLFAPCRNAAFARLNLLLPEAVKRRILFTVFPSTTDLQGFVSYYDSCTPTKIASISEQTGLRVVETKTYYSSMYFSFFFPLHLVWRLWTVLVRATDRRDLCETFSIALQRV